MGLKIIFICTGNTCRSPLAEVLARQVFGAEVEVCSAGLAAWQGQAASEHAMLVAGEHGTSLNEHRARAVRVELLEAADWIIPMTAAQQERLVSAYPQFADKIKRLGEWVDGADVHDPWGGSLKQYRQTATQIKHMLEHMQAKLADMSGRDLSHNVEME